MLKLPCCVWRCLSSPTPYARSAARVSCRERVLCFSMSGGRCRDDPCPFEDAEPDVPEHFGMPPGFALANDPADDEDPQAADPADATVNFTAAEMEEFANPGYEANPVNWQTMGKTEAKRQFCLNDNDVRPSCVHIAVSLVERTLPCMLVRTGRIPAVRRD